MDNLFAGNVGSSTSEWFPIALMLSSVLRSSDLHSPAIPVNISMAGLKSELVTGFTPELWPESFRNGGRNDSGIVAGLPRNPQ
jgi:hypothetical protein